MSDQEPASYRDILNRSAALLRQNRPGEALQLLEPLQNQIEPDPDLAINLGGAYILQRKWDKAVKVLKAASVATPDNVMIWVNLGAAYLGRLETAGPAHQKRAIAAYEQALRLDPLVPNVHYHLGLIYKERGEINRASAFFQRALEVNPADKDARYWMKRLDKIERKLKRASGAEQTDEAQTDGAPNRRSDGEGIADE